MARALAAVGGTLVMMVGISLLTGCQANGGGSNVRAYQAVEHPFLAGIPIPKGYEPVDEATSAYQSTEFRSAEYEFKGPLSRNALLRFYLDQMPEAGYRLLYRSDRRGVYELRYQNANEVCWVIIGNRVVGTYLRLQVRPLTEGALDPANAGGPPVP